MGCVLVYQTTVEIRMNHAGRNVQEVKNVQEIKLVLEINAEILVPEFVVKILNVML